MDERWKRIAFSETYPIRRCRRAMRHKDCNARVRNDIRTPVARFRCGGEALPAMSSRRRRDLLCSKSPLDLWFARLAVGMHVPRNVGGSRWKTGLGAIKQLPMVRK